MALLFAFDVGQEGLHIRNQQRDSGFPMKRVWSYRAAVLAALLFPVSVAAEVATPSSREEAQAHGHHFYSERLFGGTDLISYVVCNKTDEESDFFWTGAAFGVSELEPLPPHHCVEKKDYLRRTKTVSPDFVSEPSKTYVIDKSGEVPTVFWCELWGLDRCADGLIGSVISWSSQLREFAEGADDKPFQPLVSVDVNIEGGKYLIDIRRSEDTGQLLVIAKRPSLDGVVLKPGPGTEAKFGSLGDFFSGTEQSIGIGLTSDMPTVAVFSPATRDQAIRLTFENQTGTGIALSVVVADGVGLVYRIDTVPLQAWK